MSSDVAHGALEYDYPKTWNGSKVEYGHLESFYDSDVCVMQCAAQIIIIRICSSSPKPDQIVAAISPTSEHKVHSF